MKIYAVYEKSTGKIEYICRNQNGSKPTIEEHQECIEVKQNTWNRFNNVVAYPQQKDLYYIEETNSFEERDWMEVPCQISKTIFLADSQDSVVISNLPIPSKVYINNFPYIVDDGEFEICMDYPGRYTILITSSRYRDKEYIITAE
jgi:hypothetical protein